MGTIKNYGRDQSLDVVRGIAILLAMGWHLNTRTGVQLFDVLLEPGRRFGWAGVDLFFVLSGFLIGGLVLRERKRTDNFDAREFLIRRAIRLWPVVWVFLAAQLIVSDKPWNTFLFQNLLHVQNFWPSSISHLWSLAVEEHFYLILAIFLVLALRWKRALPEYVLIVLACIIIISPILRTAAAALGASYQSIQWQTQYRIDALACGVLLALVKQYWEGVFDAIQSKRIVLTIILSASIAFLIAFGKGSFIGVTLGFTVAYVGSAALLLLIYRSSAVRAWSWLFLPISIIGVYSYSIYVWHVAAANLAARVAGKIGITSGVAIVCLKYAAAFGLAAAMYYAVERPVMLLRERLAPPRSPPPI